MVTEIEGTIGGVFGAKTRGGGDKYEIHFSDGNTYTAFNIEDAQKAMQFVSLPGQPPKPVTIRVEHKPSKDGKRTWLNFLDVAPQGTQLPPLATPDAPGTQIPAGTPVPQAQNGGPPIPQKPDYAREYSPETQRRMSFHAATEAAAILVGQLYAGAGPEAEEQALQSLKNVTNAILDGVALQAGTPAVQPVTPQAVAEEINAEVAGAVQVGAGSPRW